LGFERQPPKALVEAIERKGALGELERATRLAAGEADASDPLQQFEVGRAQPPHLTFGPWVIGASERFADKERECMFEQLLLRSVVCCESRFCEQPLKLVDVDLDVGSIEPVAVVFARDRGPEQPPRGAHSLAEPRPRPARIDAGPERLEQLVALDGPRVE